MIIMLLVTIFLFRLVPVLCFAFCLCFLFYVLFCVLCCIYVLRFAFSFCFVFFYVHLHQLFVVMSNNAANNGDTDTPGKHKICKNRFVRTHKLPIAPCPMSFNVSFDEIILNLAPPVFFNTHFCFQRNFVE